MVNFEEVWRVLSIKDDIKSENLEAHFLLGVLGLTTLENPGESWLDGDYGFVDDLLDF